MPQIVNLRFDRINRDSILEDPSSTPVQRAQAYAEFYRQIRIAYEQGVSRDEILAGAAISRQRLWQILRTPPAAPRTTTVQLPETDL